MSHLTFKAHECKCNLEQGLPYTPLASILTRLIKRLFVDKSVPQKLIT